MEIANRTLSDRASTRICSPEELGAAGGSADRELAILRIFSAKEALYKAVGPLFGIFLAFEDVSVELIDDHIFTARILRARVDGKVIASPVAGEVEIQSILTHGLVVSGCMISIA